MHGSPTVGDPSVHRLPSVPGSAAPDDGPLINDGLPFLRAHAVAAGLRRRDLGRLVREGAVRQDVRGVYVDGRVPADLASRARSLGLRLPPGAAVSRLTAAWLLGIDGRSPDQLSTPLPVECTVPPGREPLSRPGIRCFVAPLRDGDVVDVAGLPCTSPARTAVDLLRWLPPHMGLGVADALAAAGLVAPAGLVGAVERFRGAKGVAQARYLAALVEPRTESFGESWLRLRVVDAGFPRPQVQVEVAPVMSGGPPRRLDLGWPKRLVALEYDGERYHSSPAQRMHDEERRRDLEDRFGWRILAVGRGEVLGPSMALEAAIGELLGMEPRLRRRRW